jgi:hypothetical protein
MLPSETKTYMFEYLSGPIKLYCCIVRVDRVGLEKEDFSDKKI